MTDQVSIATVIAHLTRIEAKVDASTKRSDERHEETKRELKELRAEIKLLRANDELHQGAVKIVEERIRVVEDRMAKLEAEHDRAKRASIEGESAQQQALMGAMQIVQKQQEKLREDFVEAQRNTANALASLATALPGALTKLPRWARISLTVGLVLGSFVAGILTVLFERGFIRF